MRYEISYKIEGCNCICCRPELNHLEPIEVQIVYDTEGRLARAYNRGMRRAKSEWVLFIDHDLYICNPHWYQICIKAIQLVGHRTAWISAVTNLIGNPSQLASFGSDKLDEQNPIPKSHDLVEHFAYARKLYEHWGNQVMKCLGAMSGFWILTHKHAWKRAGGFDENRKRLLGVDNVYSRWVSRAGYVHYKIPGLYVYHIWRQKKNYLRW